MSIDTQIARIARERNALFLKLMQMGIVSVDWDNLDLGSMANIIYWDEYCSDNLCTCSQETLEEEGCLCGGGSCSWNGDVVLEVNNLDEGNYSIDYSAPDGLDYDHEGNHYLESIYDKVSGILRFRCSTYGPFGIQVGDNYHYVKPGETFYFPCHNDTIKIIPLPGSLQDSSGTWYFTIGLLPESEISKLASCIDHVENIPVQTNYGASGSPGDFPGLLEFPKGYYNQNIILDYT